MADLDYPRISCVNDGIDLRIGELASVSGILYSEAEKGSAFIIIILPTTWETMSITIIDRGGLYQTIASDARLDVLIERTEDGFRANSGDIDFI